MILPTKHLTLSNSLLNTGAILLKRINGTQTVSLLWDNTRTLPEIKTYERFTLGLDFLYLTGLIEIENGIIVQVKP